MLYALILIATAASMGLFFILALLKVEELKLKNKRRLEKKLLDDEVNKVEDA